MDTRQVKREAVCLSCKHYNFDKTCRAFPEGIPTDILLGKATHDTPRAGDGGKQFEVIVLSA